MKFALDIREVIFEACQSVMASGNTDGRHIQAAVQARIDSLPDEERHYLQSQLLLMICREEDQVSQVVNH